MRVAVIHQKKPVSLALRILRLLKNSKAIPPSMTADQLVRLTSRDRAAVDSALELLMKARVVEWNRQKGADAAYGWRDEAKINRLLNGEERLR